MRISTKQLFNLKGTALPWLILGGVYLLINLFVIGTARFEFQWGMLYTFAFLGIALVLAESTASLVSGLAVAVLGVAVVFAQLKAIPVMPALILGAFAFIVIFLSDIGLFTWKTKGDFKMLAFVPFFLILGWAALYFYQRLSNPAVYGPLNNLPTILNHGGVALLCFDGIIRVSGAYKKQWLAMIALLIAVIGAFWLTYILGWGLALIPP
jgi:hypothetical protein